MEFSEIVQQRFSVKSYDPEKTISDAELRELFDEVVLSPSSYNLQHWTFIAVKEPVIKKKLKAGGLESAADGGLFRGSSGVWQAGRLQRRSQNL